jgi:formylglycine-generating enzyme required for sulfatase activity
MPSVRIRYPGGQLDLGASDWEAPNKGRRATLKPFELDSVEVTLARWRECQQAGHCGELSVAGAGVAISNVSAAEAIAFCDFAGGRLPTGDEWMFAAGGEKGRRFAWGQTGLVCRRAAFGLSDGPCARGADRPELAGARPDGRSPEGAYDLSGNVAEWAREPDGSFRARGGSFRSRVAGELKTWSEESTGPAAHVGFRCAYDVR